MINKIYFYTKHQYKGASSRYRSIQYFDYLNNRGIEIKHRYLFSDLYLNLKYKGSHLCFFIAFISYCRRFLNLISDARKGNVFVIEKELFPYFFGVFEKLIKVLGVKYILDYDDAVWHNYDCNKRFIIRFFLSKKHPKLIRNADAVICGNDYLSNYVKISGQNRVYILPTVLSAEKYNAEYLAADKNKKITIVWIGSPSTSKYLLDIDSALKRITDEFDVTIRLIGFDATLIDKISFTYDLNEWEQEKEIAQLAESHIGIMPLPDKPFEKGKCGFKLIQYMAVKLPLVASPVGVNNILIKEGVNGIKCSDTEEWYNALSLLIKSEKLRNSMGNEGRKMFLENYCLEVTCLKYERILNSI